MSVLVAVADDGVREQVLDVAVDLGQALGAELTVVHLTEAETADAETRAVRDDVRAELEDRGVEFSVSIEHVEHRGTRPGTAVGRQLADIAAEVAVTHVVIGHRSRSLLTRFVEGSTAFALADATDVPVTVVPEDVAGTTASGDRGDATGT